MTIKNLYPKARPQVIYNVINGRPELPAASTFSRASEGTYVDSSGIIQTAAIDEPRFNHDPTTGEFLGLLLDKATENLVQWSSDPQAYSTANSIAWNPISATFGHTDPMGQSNACEIEVGPGDDDFVYWRDIRRTGNVTPGKIYWISLFVKPVAGGSDTISFQIDQNNFSGRRSHYKYTASTNNFTEISSSDSLELKVDNYPDGWVRLSLKLKANPNGSSPYEWVLINRPPNETDPVEKYQLYGWQIQQSLVLSGYIPVYDSQTVAAATADDKFSLTSSSNFDNGFSLLLDSNTTTDDFIYKIKAGGSTIAELTNSNGTFDWIINGTSAANSVPPQYPQIGLIQPGRIKTVSSFGAAGDGDQTNYLYTEGLSLPTVAEPAVGADELEFGPGQTLKVVYLWNGQLSSVEAVSVIKGKYNVVIDEPIKSDSYSFVYDTDPTNEGIALITLPYIVPTVSMRIYWGDATSTRYEQGVLPQHVYPYPGQYRIQIVADDGFDAVRLADVSGTIMRVDQWAPQHRVGAAGDGFTGTDLIYMLNSQGYCTFAPPFEYSDLTDITSIFNSCGRLAPNGWDFVPTQLQSCTDTSAAFNYLGGAVGTSAERAVFPQLVTSGALTTINNLFTNARLSGFVTSSGAPTNKPLTDTSNVTNFTGAFSNCDLTDIDLDISSATGLSSTFYGNNFATMPNLGFGNITNLYKTWYSCRSLTGFSSLPDFSSVTNFQSTWYACSSLTSFPLIDTSSGTSFSSAWYNCSSLTSFPLIDTSSGTNFAGTWSGCTSLESFPEIDTSSGTKFNSAWKSVALKSFPSLDFSKATTVKGTWAYCNSLTTFPANMFDTTGTLLSDAFELAWTNCALTKTSIENILVSLDANGASNIELGIDGGANAGQSNWTAAANTAYASLINKGWTITFNA